MKPIAIRMIPRRAILPNLRDRRPNDKGIAGSFFAGTPVPAVAQEGPPPPSDNELFQQILDPGRTTACEAFAILISERGYDRSGLLAAMAMKASPQPDTVPNEGFREFAANHFDTPLGARFEILRRGGLDAVRKAYSHLVQSGHRKEVLAYRMLLNADPEVAAFAREQLPKDRAEPVAALPAHIGITKAETVGIRTVQLPNGWTVKIYLGETRWIKHGRFETPFGYASSIDPWPKRLVADSVEGFMSEEQFFRLYSGEEEDPNIQSNPIRAFSRLTLKASIPGGTLILDFDPQKNTMSARVEQSYYDKVSSIFNRGMGGFGFDTIY